MAQIRLGEKLKNELNILLRTASAMSEDDNISQGLLSGKLSLSQRRQISELVKTETFESLLDDMQRNEAEWTAFMNEPAAEGMTPLSFLKTNSLNENDKLLLEEVAKMVILLIFRPDRMTTSVKQFLKLVFDERFATIPELDLEKSHRKRN